MPPIYINDQEVIKRYVGIQEVVAAYVGSQQVFASGVQFSAIQNLFASSEQGFLPNPNDFATLFQDSAGTTPVTAANQPIGKILDQSGRGNHVTQATAGNRPYLRGTPLGANLVTDPFFYSGANWTAGSGWTIASPAAGAVTSSAALSLSGLAAEVGKVYLVAYTVQTRTAGSVAVSFGGATGRSITGVGVFYEYLTTVSTAGLALTGTGFSGKVRGLSVWDASAGAVGAPYSFDFNGTTAFLSRASMISAYPFTMGSDTQVFGSTCGLFSLHQSDVDWKGTDPSGRSLDWKEATISAYGGDGAYNGAHNVQLCQFATSSNVTEDELLAGSAAAHSNTFGTKTTLFFGKGRSGDFIFTGICSGGFVIDRTLTSDEKTLVNTFYGANKAIQCWGDSMTAGSGVGVTVGYPIRLRELVARSIDNKGAGGETSTQIKDRFVADTTNKDQWTNIFWMGTNDAYPADWPTTILNNIATCVSGLKGAKRYLVLGVTKAESGSPTPAALTALDASLLSIYGDKFVDVRAYLQSKNDGSANDLADIAAGLVPRSLRSDTIHLNDKGYQHVADLLAATLKAKGWV